MCCRFVNSEKTNFSSIFFSLALKHFLGNKETVGFNSKQHQHSIGRISKILFHGNKGSRKSRVTGKDPSITFITKVNKLLPNNNGHVISNTTLTPSRNSNLKNSQDSHTKRLFVSKVNKTGLHNGSFSISNKTTSTLSIITNLTAEPIKNSPGNKRYHFGGHYYHPVHRYNHRRHRHHFHDDENYDEDEEDDREFFRHHISPVEPISENIEPIPRMGHVEPIDPIDPMEPIESIEPIDRIEEIEPAEPIEKIEGMESMVPMKSIEEEDGETKSKIPKRYNRSISFNNYRRYLSKHNLTNHHYHLAPHVEETPIERNPNYALDVTSDRVFSLPSGTTLVNLDGHQNWRAIMGARGALGVLHPATGATGAEYSARGAVDSRIGVHEPASGVTNPAVGVTDPATGATKEPVKATGAGPDSKTEKGTKLPPNEGYKKDELVDCKKANNSSVNNGSKIINANENIASKKTPVLPSPDVNTLAESLGLDSVASLNIMIERLKNESDNFQNSRKYTESVVKLVQNFTKALNGSTSEKVEVRQQTHLNHYAEQKTNGSSADLLKMEGKDHSKEMIMAEKEKELLMIHQQMMNSTTKKQLFNTTTASNEILLNVPSDKFNSTQVEHRSMERVINRKDSFNSTKIEKGLGENPNNHNSTTYNNQTLLDLKKLKNLKGKFLHKNSADNETYFKQLPVGNGSLTRKNTRKVNLTELTGTKNSNKVSLLKHDKNITVKVKKSNSTESNNKQLQNDNTSKRIPQSLMINGGDRRGIVIPKLPNPPISLRIEEYKEADTIKPIKLKEDPIPIKETKIKESLDESPDIEPIDVGQLTSRLLEEQIKPIEPISSKIPDIEKNPAIEPNPPIPPIPPI